ncbi:MAG: SMC family ATPase [Anaerolineae bacterium]|nr:SMC family ATPase [Anaerolineae bacterium]
MIPVKLELYNFLAYRSPEPIDLTGLHVVCLAGENGAGKSSLLDAITWALWGKARTHRDDELIHMGESEMQVTFTFRLNSHLYQAMRHRSSQGRGASTLDFRIQSDDGKWRSLAETTLRATQEKITRTLLIDYETFINSAFLMQGRADEFTQKTPAERKAILSDILGLSLWNLYEDKAKARAHELDLDIRQDDARIEEIDAELEMEPVYRKRLDDAQAVLNDATAAAEAAETRVRELDGVRQEMDTQTRRYEDDRARARDDEVELARLQRELSEQQARHAAVAQVLAEHDDIEAGYAALQQARELENIQNALLLQQASLKEQQNALRLQISSAEGDLQASLQALDAQRPALERTIREGHDQDGLDHHHQQVARLESLEQEEKTLEAQVTASKEMLAGLEAENRELKKQMDELAGRRDRILELDTPVCPLCGQPLSEAHRQEMVERLNAEGTPKGDTFRANKARIDKLIDGIERADRRLREIRPDLKGLPALREFVAKLIERDSRAQRAQAELEQLDTRSVVIRDRLSQRDFAPEAHAELAEIERQLAALGYDDQAYRAVRTMLESYQSYESRFNALERARTDGPQIESALEELRARTASWQERITRTQTVLEALFDQIQALQERLSDYDRLRAEYTALHEQESTARNKLGRAEQQLHTLEDLRRRRAELIERRSQNVVERGIFDDLRRAFGRDGVPAMIIEAAIPEIETEANLILSDMTAGRMHIQFDTQREKVTGGTRETLDIRISDNLGTRDYATFSGGESFRVDFAIRLALSRVLARRAGAQLRTLIIDEGFGTQDAQGRERLVQAINSIQDEFDLIMVITHIDELKDAFPARVEITKTPQGSIAELV